VHAITLPLSAARARFSELVDEAVRTHQRLEITRHGYRVAILLSADDFDSLEETLDILADPELMQEIATAREEIGRDETWTLEEVTAENACSRPPPSVTFESSSTSGQASSY
jgi:antitoxin YefM